MTDIYVTVQGPGSCINYEMEVIRAALAAKGVRVEVENDHADVNPENHVKDLDEKARNGSWDPSHWKVKLKAIHDPWGG